MVRGSILAALMLATPVARAQDLVDYTVREGDTCASIARRLYGDSRAYDRIHAHNPGMGPPPHRLEPGTVLHLPRAARDEGPDARISALRRRVDARSPRAEAWNRAEIGQPLAGGWQVATRDASSAELTFRDRSMLEMRAHTLVVIYGGSRSLARRTDARATLERGALRSRLAELAGVVDVATPTARAQIGSGEAVMTVEEDGTSRLANLGGRAATVSTDTGRVRVPAGTGTLVRRGQAPSPPHPLPPPPSWSNDLAGRFVGLTGGGGTLRGSWEPVEGAARYRVEIAARPDGTDIVAAVEVPGDVNDFEIHRLPPGVYYASVATIDEALFEGTPSPLRAMQVLSARIIPPGGTEPVEEPYDPGDPSRPPSMPRVLPGTWVVSPIGMRCGAGEGAPREMITLHAPGPTRVRCFDAADRELPGFEVLVLRVRTRIEDGARVRPGVPSEVRLRLDPALPPGVRLVAEAPGATAGRPRRTHDGAVIVPITAEPDLRARSIPLTLTMLAADERIEIAATTLTVATPGAFGVPDTVEPPIDEPPLPPSALALDASATGSEPTVPLRYAVTRGFVAWAAAGRDLGDRSTSVILGARARVFDSPLRIGLGWAFPDGGAVRGDVALPFLTADALTLTASFDLGVPLERDRSRRFAPGLELDYALSSSLFLRARAAGVFRDPAAPADVAGALGLELVPSRYFAAALELDGTIRGEVEAALSASAHLDPLELVVSAATDGESVTAAFALRAAFAR